jgi:orotidine-5'-phosphate decarboxylase
MSRSTRLESFAEMLHGAQQMNQSMLCVGLDPDLSRFPDGVAPRPESIVSFNRAIIEATSDIVSCYKPNMGFYLPFGAAGIDALEQIRRDVPAHVPVLLDAKMGDIDITSRGYARAVFDTWGFDAVTVNPFLGYDSLQPFIEYADRGIFVLAKTSHAGSGLLQDRRLVGDDSFTVSETVAHHASAWNVHGNIGLVVGATYPQQIADLRVIAPDLPFLVPGIGAQSGDLESAVRAGLDKRGTGVIVNASRAVTYASSGADFRDAARHTALGLRDAINRART